MVVGQRGYWYNKYEPGFRWPTEYPEAVKGAHSPETRPGINLVGGSWMAYYIPSHQTLGQHPKTKKLARTLKVSLPCAVGHLQYLWWWALDYAQDGDISQYDHDDVADASLWEGDALEFWLALIHAGFVDDLVEEGRAQIHDWPEYGGRLLEKRRSDALRKERARTSYGSPTDIRVTAQVEKRKEEKTEEKRKEENIREPAAPGVRHKPVDEEFLLSLEGEFPKVNVRDVYARAQNRKTWDGYKDKRRALRDHIGYALKDQKEVTTNGSRPTVSVASKFADYG